MDHQIGEVGSMGKVIDIVALVREAKAASERIEEARPRLAKAAVEAIRKGDHEAFCRIREEYRAVLRSGPPIFGDDHFPAWPEVMIL
jgi:hypothetical protein